MIFISELAYSLHLGSDKNRKNISREKAKTNNSGTTSLPNSAIQNASHLTRVDKHNYRKYDNKAEDIVIVRGTTSLVDDVKKALDKGGIFISSGINLSIGPLYVISSRISR